jgi:hypothetical protein
MRPEHSLVSRFSPRLRRPQERAALEKRTLSSFGNNRLLPKLWYRQPAREWTQALPVGNGRLAAMMFGDPRQEHLQLNEDMVWSGEKRDRSNPAAAGAVPEIQRLLQEGHPAQAQEMADRTMIGIPRALPGLPDSRR